MARKDDQKKVVKYALLRGRLVPRDEVLKAELGLDKDVEIQDPESPKEPETEQPKEKTQDKPKSKKKDKEPDVKDFAVDSK